jgi:acyl carrier protein phosphodiesterase
MNFLAHLYLSSEEPDALAGSLLPDLVRGPVPADASPTLQAACRLHRLVDVFTDTHPLHARSRGRIAAVQSRYAGILVDVFYDHFLARDWSQYCSEPLPLFTARIYQLLLGHRPHLPPDMQHALDMMVHEDWLTSYARPEGIAMILARMSRRFSRRFDRPVDLVPAMQDLATHNQAMGQEFHAFFPQLIQYARQKEPEVSRQT